MRPLLSVVVASYTMARLPALLELLESVEAQSYTPIEILIVIEQSRDLYDALCLETGMEELHERNKRLLWNADAAGLSSNRNLGLREAKGTIIAFVDDDVVLPPAWAREVVACFQDETVVAVTGPAFPLWLDERMKWIPEEFDWLLSCTSWANWNEVRDVRNVWGYNMAFRREAFDVAGPFLTTLGLRDGGGPLAEDTEISLRVRARTGKRIVYDPRAWVRHRVESHRLSWRFVAERSFFMGKSRAMLGTFCHGVAGSEAILGTEYGLLRRIAAHLLPSILKGFIKRPDISWRRLCLSVASLSFVALGYGWGLFQVAVERVVRRSSQG